MLISGVLEHVYRSMEDFLTECLSLDTDEQPRAAEPASWTRHTPHPTPETAPVCITAAVHLLQIVFM